MGEVAVELNMGCLQQICHFHVKAGNFWSVLHTCMACKWITWWYGLRWFMSMQARICLCLCGLHLNGKPLHYSSFSHLSSWHVCLQAAAWTCSWDLNDSNYIYAGLQVWCYIVFISTACIIYMLAKSCLQFLESLFLILSASTCIASFSCRMAIFWCLTCAKPQGLLNPWRGWQTTQFILCILFHLIQLFPFVLEQWYPHQQLAYVCGVLVVL